MFSHSTCIYGLILMYPITSCNLHTPYKRPTVNDLDRTSKQTQYIVLFTNIKSIKQTLHTKTCVK